MGSIAARAWAMVDRSTRLWWRAVGRRADRMSWLEAPVGGRDVDWLASLQRPDGTEGVSGAAGILPDLAVLDGPGFAARRLHPDVRDFYQHTAAWQMDLWIRWSPLFAPWGGLLARWFGQRVRQLAIPVDPLAPAQGLDSTVRPIVDDGGRPVAAA